MLLLMVIYPLGNHSNGLYCCLRSSLFLSSSQGIFLFPCWSILWFCSILLMFDQKFCLTCFSGHFIVSDQANFNFKSWDVLNSYGQYPPLLQSRHLSLKPGHNTLGVRGLTGVEFLGKSCTGSVCFCKDFSSPPAYWYGMWYWNAGTGMVKMGNGPELLFNITFCRFLGWSAVSHYSISPGMENLPQSLIQENLSCLQMHIHI